MGLLNRLTRGRRDGPDIERSWPSGPTVLASVLVGTEDLEVVGELQYQDALWRLCGAAQGDRIRHPITAVLVPEPTNPHDANAVAVQIDGHMVGYLSRATAQEYLSGLHQAMSARGGYIALQGVIVGGGYYADGPGRLGVWLEHDPADFGIVTAKPAQTSPPGLGMPSGVMRTGFTEAWLTDLEDDSYDLAWFNELPEADQPAIAKLRELLSSDPDLIDRHFQFAELETRLYRSRDLYLGALDEYDETCLRHDAEMDAICEAFAEKWEKVPLLETYRQMAIRQQKKKDWQSCQWWAERGLALYGNRAAREEAVEDLIKRRNRAIAKLDSVPRSPRPNTPGDFATVVAPPSSTSASISEVVDLEVEVLTCGDCHGSFERVRVRGRKPLLCLTCRSRPQS